MPVPHVPRVDIERVFEAWRAHKERPDICKLRTDRSNMIRARLRTGYTAQEIVDVIDYIHKADEEDPKFMRGANGRRRKYLGLDNILRIDRLAGRVEAATIWKEEMEGRGTMELGDTNPWEIS